MDNRVIILAAGEGRRMRSKTPKVMCEVLGEPMIDWVLDSAAAAGIPEEHVGIVTGSGADIVKAHIAKRSEAYRIFTQDERKGPAHAVMQAEKMLEGGGNVLVLCGDRPFADGAAISAALKEHESSGNSVTVVTADLPDPADRARVIRAEDGSVSAVIESADCTLPQLGITEVASGIFWFRADALAEALPKITADNKQGEYRLSDAVAAICSAGGKAGAYISRDTNIVLGADTRAELLSLNIIAKMRVIAKHLDNGVEFVSTDGVIIGRDVTIGADTRILPGTILRGKTTIGEGCVLGPNTLIENCRIGNGVILNSVQAYDSRVCDHVKAGPFVQLRPGTVLHDGVKIGDFVEVKNSEIGVNTAIAHLTYVGDSDVGKGVNFGCGCVTANYDGINKYRTKIGDYAFIGCNTNLIAPVEIGENATTAAGSTITKSVPPDSLAVERAQTKIIDHWEKNSLRIKKA
ncbi:MAG: bifunctional UDP-N-acetylglucosamine diphosphorylase/glucosamine-1-phosphate N-acetyltransferase GlmU [Ruminiclostridium sp.]|nr:bifunctional UDP-N-acetylglucosamine diphosphorylase/glucosamine-1-phosphate N-acetyltransferase GlmU [Ruminiclostridium sp.]